MKPDRQANDSKSSDRYGEDLAYIHDAGFGAYAKHAGVLLLESLRQRHIDRGLVIDLGCGSGILSEELSAAGYDVLGIDISPAFIEMARTRVPKGEFRVQSLLSATLPSCVAVAAVGECCNYLFDRSNSMATLGKLFRRVYNALDAGGLFLFDLIGPGRVPKPGWQRVYKEGDDWAVLALNEENPRRRLLTRTITSFRKVGELYRREHEVHRVRLYPRTEVVAQLRDIGFSVRTLKSYGDLRFTRAHTGYLARKPK